MRDKMKIELTKEDIEVLKMCTEQYWFQNITFTDVIYKKQFLEEVSRFNYIFDEMLKEND